MNHKPECNEKWGYDKDHCICDWIDKAEQRIIKLLEVWWETDQELEELIALIKVEHKHDIDVFGAPCACGTHHEYCNNCDWVEPCEIDGENK